ncbi:MAG: RNA 2',3'-cyclic phosphodiesterase [Candidatus Krumholzibacteriota bacterium]|nr:RNA 2',3'-cyclic phosphodiesterase [Candidatus Krumholzibacteriota bacterium]
MRLFFAVPVAPEVRERVSSIIRQSSLRDAPWRWIPPVNYHFTLKFLGEVDQVLLSPLREAATLVAGEIPPFEITYDRFGGFPDLRRPRVLFYDLGGGREPFRRLAEAVESAVESLGFARESRTFRAHLTLARIKRPLSAETRERLLEIPSLPDNTRQRIDNFVLMRSRLSRSGAVYEEVEKYGLGSGG